MGAYPPSSSSTRAIDSPSHSSLPVRARMQAVASGCVPRLLAMMAGGASPADAAAAPDAAVALMGITRAKEGKEAFARAGGAAALASLLQRAAADAVDASGSGGSGGVCEPAHLLQIAANAAELPDCRTQLAEAGVPAAVDAVARRAQQQAAGGAEAAAAAAAAALVARAAAEASRLMRFHNWPQ